jgi:hypothetical protein
MDRSRCGIGGSLSLGGLDRSSRKCMGVDLDPMNGKGPDLRFTSEQTSARSTELFRPQTSIFLSPFFLSLFFSLSSQMQWNCDFFVPFKSH